MPEQTDGRDSPAPPTTAFVNDGGLRDTLDFVADGLALVGRLDSEGVAFDERARTGVARLLHELITAVEYAAELATAEQARIREMERINAEAAAMKGTGEDAEFCWRDSDVGAALDVCRTLAERLEAVQAAPAPTREGVS